MAMQPVPRGRRVALVSNSTALLLHTMDLVEAAGMQTVARPYRVHWDAGADAVGSVLAAALAAEDVDAVVVIHVPPVRTDLSGVAEVLRDVAVDSSKPVLAVLPHETGLTGRSSLVSNPGRSGFRAGFGSGLRRARGGGGRALAGGPTCRLAVGAGGEEPAGEGWTSSAPSGWSSRRWARPRRCRSTIGGRRSSGRGRRRRPSSSR